jgi:hypothetical protein
VSATNPEFTTAEDLTDLGNSRRVVRLHGKVLRFCRGLGGWQHRDGRRWQRDETGEVVRRAGSTARSIYVDKIQTIPRAKLRQRVGTLDEPTLRRVEEALSRFLGLT